MVFLLSILHVDIDPSVSTIPAILAKSSLVWTSIFYLFSSKHLRNRDKSLKIVKGGNLFFLPFFKILIFEYFSKSSS